MTLSGIAIRKGLTFGRALQAHLRLPLVAERGQPTRYSRA